MHACKQTPSGLEKMIFIRIHEKIANQCWRQHPAVHVHVAKTGKKMKAKVKIDETYG